MVGLATNSSLGIVKGNAAENGVNVTVDGKLEVPAITELNVCLTNINDILVNAI
jgi:hypothetical protein